jgi:bile acid-coenzyme A ligase
LGNIVHAIVEAEEEAASPEQLLEFVSERLARYKVPRSIEYTDQPLRDDAGKVRRSGLRAERASTPRQ